MSKKYTKKKTGQKRSLSLKLTALLIGVAFLLGLFIEDLTVSVNYFEKSVKAVTSSLHSWTSRLGFRDDSDGLAEYYFFDVGQGSSTLLKAHDGTTILIDTGRYDDEERRIISYLNEEIGVGGTIDLLIFTHNDADHIGNGDLVLEYFQVEEVWMNGMDHTSQTYSHVLDTLLASEAKYVEPKKGYEIELGAFSIEVLHPEISEVQDDQNDESLVTRIRVGDTYLMQTGDASTTVENDLLDTLSPDFQADIIVLGHHGSNTSTSDRWLSELNPDVAVYQAGDGNQYGHPHRQVIERLNDYEVKVLGTDEYGTIQINIEEGNQLELITGEAN